MASAINLVAGDAPSKPSRMVAASVDFAAVTSYTAGGEVDAVLADALSRIGDGNYASLAQAAHNGTTTRWFKVDEASGKVMAFTTASLEVEVTGGTDLSGYTAIPVMCLGAG